MRKYRFGDEIHTVPILINNLIPPRPSASAIMLKPEIPAFFTRIWMTAHPSAVCMLNPEALNFAAADSR
jgi:hypothetical protein